MDTLQPDGSRDRDRMNVGRALKFETGRLPLNDSEDREIEFLQECEFTEEFVDNYRSLGLRVEWKRCANEDYGEIVVTRMPSHLHEWTREFVRQVLQSSSSSFELLCSAGQPRQRLEDVIFYTDGALFPNYMEEEMEELYRDGCEGSLETLCIEVGARQTGASLEKRVRDLFRKSVLPRLVVSVNMSIHSELTHEQLPVSKPFAQLPIFRFTVSLYQRENPGSPLQTLELGDYLSKARGGGKFGGAQTSEREEERSMGEVQHRRTKDVLYLPVQELYYGRKWSNDQKYAGAFMECDFSQLFPTIQHFSKMIVHNSRKSHPTALLLKTSQCRSYGVKRRFAVPVLPTRVLTSPRSPGGLYSVLCV